MISPRKNFASPPTLSASGGVELSSLEDLDDGFDEDFDDDFDDDFDEDFEEADEEYPGKLNK
jgi:hypothetical protein